MKSAITERKVNIAVDSCRVFIGAHRTHMALRRRRSTFHGLCACLSVRQTGEPCKNGWTDQDAILKTDSCVPKEPCIKWVGCTLLPPSEYD